MLSIDQIQTKNRGLSGEIKLESAPLQPLQPSKLGRNDKGLPLVISQNITLLNSDVGNSTNVNSSLIIDAILPRLIYNKTDSQQAGSNILSNLYKIVLLLE
jgi:hypothetical protein